MLLQISLYKVPGEKMNQTNIAHRKTDHAHDKYRVYSGWGLWEMRVVAKYYQLVFNGLRFEPASLEPRNSSIA